jgi:LEA14-like dessication related protein
MIRKITLLMICIALLSSCSVYKEVEVKEVLNVEVLSFDNNGADCDVYLSVLNPNGYKITLTESDIDLFFEGKPLGEVKLLEKIELPKNSLTTIKMKCQANVESVQGVLGNIITLLFKTEYTLEGKGYIKGKALLISKKVPVVFNEKLKKEDLGF